MRLRRAHALLLAAAGLAGAVASTGAQRQDAFPESRDHPAIGYSAAAPDNRVEALNRRLADGSLEWSFDPRTGYLRAALEALGLPVESQVLVFSPTSFQASLIGVRNPRALYFDDDVFVGWVRDGPLLEVAVHDPRVGAVFYDLPQAPVERPQFTRNDECLACHLSWETLAVPGLLMTSTAPRRSENDYASGFTTDHRSPFIQRWGGWYVTGEPGGPHMGNVPVAPDELDALAIAAPSAALPSVDGLFDTTGFPSTRSDVSALMVLAHQTHMSNHIIRTAWEARLAAFEGTPPGVVAPRVRDAAAALVDYMLFVDEAPLPGPVRGGSGFAEAFAARGPRDRMGRSLRDLDLDRRLLRYPCSYLIYGAAFDAMPAEARDAVYRRLWEVLSGGVAGPRYAALTVEDRRAVVEILVDTKPGLPDYFDPAAF